MGGDLLNTFDQFHRLPAWKIFSNKLISNQTATAHDQDFCSAGVAGATARAKFLREANLDPPRFLRVIDCKVSVREQVVVIIDCPKKDVHGVRQFSGSSCSSVINSAIEGYTVISHTYGQHVYNAFNCGCAADCRAHVPRAADPAKFPCKHDDAELHQRVIGDVLGMCRLLVDAGVRYAWHDGVCIAQHDEKEVDYFIQHIAWIYAYADDTVVFLHYIGRPMAPIAPPSYPDGPISRWQTRAWTFQEAALSKRRRYCVRRGASLEPCFGKYDDFLQTLASWYEADGLNVITQILDESDFFNLVQEIAKSLTSVDSSTLQGVKWQQHFQWIECISTWKHLLWSLRCSFPTIAHALDSCSSRDSKHNGDRINSILGIARVKGFYAPKDDDTVEESTMDFFNRMGKAGLLLALFTTNKYDPILDARPHTWYPTLCSQLIFTPSHFRPSGPNFHTDQLECEVRSEDGNLEVRGLLACVSVRVALVDRTGSCQGIICNAGAAMSNPHDQSLSAFADFLEFSFHPAGYGCQVLLAKDNLRAPVELLGMASIMGSEAASGKNEHERQLQFWARVISQLKETAELVGRMHLHSVETNGLLTGIDALRAMKPDQLVRLARFMEGGEETSVDPSLQFLLLGAKTDLNFIESFNARLRQIEAAMGNSSESAAAACVDNNIIFWQQSNSIDFKLIFPAEVFELISNRDDDDDEFKVEYEIDMDDFGPQCRTQLSLWRSSRSFAAVVVQGHDVLSSSVKKLGCFVASPMLLQVVLQQPQCLTFLDKLVIS